mgnify:CR=1 FL=1
MYLFKAVMYGIGFFLTTILVQYFFYKIRHNIPQDKNGVMVGKNAIIVLCVLGLISDNICFFSAIIGLIIADELGKMMGWSK